MNPLAASVTNRPSPQVGTTPKETGKIPASPNAPELSGQSEAVKSAIVDISKGMPMDAFDSTYPELADKKESFASLKADLDKGMPASEIPKLYPEFYEKPSALAEAGQEIA